MALKSARMRGLSKWWQRWVLDAALTNPPPLVAVLITIFLTVFAVGFWCAHWVDQVDLAVYRSLNVFSDNISGKNLLRQLSGVLPIDVVYTWVNGSDPLLLEGLQSVSQGVQKSCSLSHCLPAPYISLMDCNTPKTAFASLPSVLEVTQVSITHNSRSHNFTVLRLAGESDVREVMDKARALTTNTTILKQAFWTSDVGGGWGMKQKHAVLVTGRAHLAPPALLESLFPQHKNIMSVCSVWGSGGVQLIECHEEDLVPGLLNANTHLGPGSSNTSFRAHQAMLMLHSDQEGHLREIDVNRFEDNEELRYSLRSLEQHAPWVRRIFLVTNGQIPHWLNLDHPRLSIITHQDIFHNISHLPTFSSPAIESHIHRIPGLSENFLYLNDDVMLGSEVWPEDFFSPGTGYKVYLSWSLPECSSGCPGSWLGDGYCDASCNTSACEWDGGDCAGELAGGDLLEGDDSVGVDDVVEFCAPSCSDLWLADHYCDHSCNTLACGFDGGDCGVDKVDRMHQLPVPKVANVTYLLPQGISVAWMNLSSVLASGTDVQGWHTEHPGLRTIIINTAQEVLFILLKANVTATLHIQLNISKQHQQHPKQELQKQHQSVKYSFVVKCNSYPVKASKSTERTRDLPVLGVKNFTFERVRPNVKPKNTRQDVSRNVEFARVDVNASKLPAHQLLQVINLETSYREGELTLNGLEKMKSQLIAEILQSSGDHRLVYHKETDWPPKVKLLENLQRNISSVNNITKLHQQESKPESITKANYSQPLNASNNWGPRALLWAENPPKKHDAVLNKSIYKWRKSKLTHIGKSKEKKHNYDGSLATYEGNLPWEKQKLFPEYNEEDEMELSLPLVARRHLLDMFAESLLHVNRLFNSEYGYQARRVPAHMPHFINKGVMESLHQKFKDEFELTSSHKIRQANDMQYAFSYYFYLMSEQRVRTLMEVFKEYDTDASGTLSDREVRTFLTALHDLPLHYNIVHDFHKLVKNCSASHSTKPVSTPVYERYADSDLPTVSLELMLKCEPLAALLKKLQKVNKYKYIHQSDDAVHFKMVTSNVSIVIHMLDEVRKNRRKFICLNSNLDPRSKSNDLIHALVQDTYESLFPLPSSFELPLNYRNRFLYIEELVAWRKWRDFVRALIYACLASLVFLTLVNFFSTELESLRRRWCRRRRRRLEGHGALKV